MEGGAAQNPEAFRLGEETFPGGDRALSRKHQNCGSGPGLGRLSRGMTVLPGRGR